MGAVAKGGQLALAGVGFLVGYGWAVHRWAGRAGIPSELGAADTLLSAGLSLSLLYALLVGLLFHSCLPSGRSTGLRMVVAPTAFTVSAVLGALGMEAALRFVG